MENSAISRETLVALHETEGIGWLTIRQLWLARRERPIRPGMREGDLRECGLQPKQAAAAAASLSADRIEARSRRRRRAGIEVVTLADPEYPRMLKRTLDPPPVLYYIGRLDLISRPAIAVVGTRLATSYGKLVAEQFAAAFSDRGFTVVSGMAKGIDSCAHRGALNRAGSTIAVLGLPVDRIYPPDNRQLYREIRDKGLLLSEAPPDMPYHHGMFPARNRVIAGLSLAVVVAEAPDESGALITAAKAVEADRPVFVVPGPVTSPRSRGGMAMLRDGTASAALAPEDVMRPFASRVDSPDEPREEPEPEAELTADEREIYKWLLDQPRTVDELSADAGIPAGSLHATLLSLQIKRKIQRLPGSLYGAL